MIGLMIQSVRSVLHLYHLYDLHLYYLQIVEKLLKNPKRGDPKILECQRNGVSTTIVMLNGGTRIMYDIVPVVSFRGWPAVAMGWLSEPHFWDTLVQEDEGSKIGIR